MAFGSRALSASFRLAAGLERTIVRSAPSSCHLRIPPVPAPRIIASHVFKRQFALSAVARHNEITPPRPGEEYDPHFLDVCNWRLMVCRLHITFVDKDGERHTFEVAEGDNLLDIAQSNDLEMEGEWAKCFVG